MVWDYSKLSGRIREICGTQDAFAAKLGISRVSLSLKMNSKSEFTQDEMFKSCDILSIPYAELSDYFFSAKGLDMLNGTG